MKENHQINPARKIKQVFLEVTEIRIIDEKTYTRDLDFLMVKGFNNSDSLGYDSVNEYSEMKIF